MDFCNQIKKSLGRSRNAFTPLSQDHKFGSTRCHRRRAKGTKLGGRGILCLPPINHSNTNQSRASIRWCMGKRADSTFLCMEKQTRLNYFIFLNGYENALVLIMLMINNNIIHTQNLVTFITDYITIKYDTFCIGAPQRHLYVLRHRFWMIKLFSILKWKMAIREKKYRYLTSLYLATMCMWKGKRKKKPCTL